MIDLINRSNFPGYRIHKKLRMLKELHALKKDLINKRLNCKLLEEIFIKSTLLKKYIREINK